MHACSVGEVNAAHPLLDAFSKHLRGHDLFLSTSTRSGFAHAQGTLPGFSTAWCPFDHPATVSRFFDAVQPRALVLIETELWPNLTRQAAQRGIPVMLANGRLSEKHISRYRRISSLVTPMVQRLHCAAMQSEMDAQRIQSLGMARDRIAVTGSVKFDGAVFEIDPARIAAIRRVIQPDLSRPVVVFGSTRPGDEARAEATRARLRDQHPGLQWILALRHPERIAEAERAFSGGGPVYRRSACTATLPWKGDGVLLIDTIGELAAIYALATVVVIGGSFDPRVQGHNPIEPAALGKPVVFGPHMRNFAEAASVLCTARGAVQVSHEEGLSESLSNLLMNPAECKAMGERSRAVIREHQGAALRTAALLASMLSGCQAQ